MRWSLPVVVSLACFGLSPSQVTAAPENGPLAMLVQAGAYLGVSLADVDAKEVERLKLPAERGALVRDVIDGSPAEKAGIQKDDVIVRFEGERVLSAVQCSRLVHETPAGRKVTLDVSRKGSPVTLTTTLAEGRDRPGLFAHSEMMMPQMPHMPDFQFDTRVSPEGGPHKLGVEFQEISGQLGDYFKLGKGESGLLVTSVEADGPAAKAGLKAGDVLVKLSGKDMRSARALRRAVAELEPGSDVSVTVMRDGKPLEVKITAGGRPEKSKTEQEKKI